MALKSTIHKAYITLSDIDRGYYAEQALTLARHPSETEERLMVRLLAWVINADEALAFGKGLSTDDEPDLWRLDLTGAVRQWIEVGLPDERRLRKACGRSPVVLVYAYGGRAMDVWWSGIAPAVRKLAQVRVWALPEDATAALAALCDRTLRLSCTLQDGEVWLTREDGQTAHVVPQRLL